ncbi:unnamed protein product [Rhizophagus irregularis]|uniref:Uncharacterized protein n=1 Tax=Rhizophagus irregularis TaxID=588596 RepID=A0A915ZKS4_9GLOM|nr:unnamed protein product [Rhizophagus irregularis]CAB5206802.1 unnamed protein product [Rhizophagus irregularis]CAB5378067.1 unnamed protein product [Rhizophagus irregularis]
MKEIPKLISNHSHISYSTQALSGMQASNEASFVSIPVLDERSKWCLLRLERHVNASDSNDDSIEKLGFPKESMEPPRHTHGLIRGHKTAKNLTTADTEYWFVSDEGIDMIWDSDFKNIVFEEDQK